MTHQIGWLVADRVLDVVLPEISNDEIMLKLDKELNDMLDGASQQTHILIDVRSMKVYPSAQAAMKMKYYQHPRLACLIAIGLTTNPVLRFLGSLVARGVGIQIKDFGTREESLAYLASVEKIRI